ncbi:unnamed protein product [Dibothriocephalus latus]|uniref:Uncharacterized protein n=1 Tax=Dibothriocephalus latus TaxID=60516 RepID=A0A3P7MRB3_DIBLA|nr:unnamed protein product [Dibothriocephalus latus]
MAVCTSGIGNQATIFNACSLRCSRAVSTPRQASSHWPLIAVVLDLYPQKRIKPSRSLRRTRLRWRKHIQRTGVLGCCGNQSTKVVEFMFVHIHIFYKNKIT